MAKDKSSVLLYCDLIHTVEKLKDVDAGKLFKHFLRYINDQDPEPPNNLIQIVFEPIKQNLKRDLKKWEKIKGNRSEAGKISAEKRRQQNSTKSTSVEFVEQTSTKSTVSVNDNVSVNVSVTDSVINFKKGFSLNGVVIEKSVSEYFKEKFSAFREQWVMKNGIEIESKVYEKMDSDYLAYSFTDLNHLQNTFKSVWKKVSEQKPEKTNSPQGTLNAYQEARQKLGLNG